MAAILSILAHLGVVLATAVLWEFIAWALHKYLMHGPGWFLHEDHHHPRGKGFQKNDLYVIIFAFTSFIQIFEGLLHGYSYLAAAGFGVALYGLGYVLFHEILFHRRVPWLRLKPRGAYLEALVASHAAHHRVATKDGGRNFSFLWPGRAGDPK